METRTKEFCTQKTHSSEACSCFRTQLARFDPDDIEVVVKTVAYMRENRETIRRKKINLIQVFKINGVDQAGPAARLWHLRGKLNALTKVLCKFPSKSFFEPRFKEPK